MTSDALTNEGNRLRKAGRLLASCTALVVMASLGASLVQSSRGRVVVQGMRIPTQNGQWVAADLFKPKTATSKSKAPLVVVVPGFQRTKESLSNISIELSRRGIVVLAIDPYSQGSSSSSRRRRSATTEGYGLFAIVDYVFDTPNLNYVDKTRIGATGHSAGGNAAILGASHFGRAADKQGDVSKLNSVYVSGYVLTLTADILQHVRSNVGASYALYDEGAFRNELKHGDMRQAPEALRLIRSGGDVDEPLAEVDVDKYYGEKTRRTLRVMHNERLLHPLQPYSFEATAHQIDYFTSVFDLLSEIPSDDQIWHWKELLTLTSTTAAFVALVPLARLLLAAPFFRSVVHAPPPPAPLPQGRDKLVLWGAVATAALVACASFVPLARWSQALFPLADGRALTWWFPQRMNNAVMLWAVVNGCVGLLIMQGVRRFAGRSQDPLLDAWGMRIGGRELTRTILLAILLFLSFFGLLFAVYYAFHVDYRFVFFGARVFQPTTFLLLLVYAPFFFVFFFANALRANVAMRFENEPQWKSLLRAGLTNILGLALIMAIQYASLAISGQVFWTDEWLYVNLLFAIIPIIFVLPYLNRYFFNLTGRIYLGATTTCLIFVTILLTNSVSYTPL